MREVKMWSMSKIVAYAALSAGLASVIVIGWVAFLRWRIEIVHGQSQPKPEHIKELPWNKGVLVEGGSCKGLSKYDDKYGSWDWRSDNTAFDDASNTKWDFPKGQVWNCVDNKWRRNFKAELREAAHFVLVAKVRDAVLVRKLSPDEITVIAEATNHDYTSNGVVYYVEHGYEIHACEVEAMRTADLIAQLSFWHPTESELPLQLLMSYVKGINCGDSARHAYAITNERIMTWLKEQK